MNSPIEVSVVIPTFRRERQLLEAVQSVLGQTSVNVEVIVVDDSPEGSARSSAESLNDPRVRYMQRKNPSGGRPALVRNEGAKLAQGEFIYFLDDDDMLVEGTLRRMVDALRQRPDAGMVFGVISPFGENPEVLAQQQNYFREARRVALQLRTGRQLQACLTYSAPVMVCSACMGRRQVFEACGGFDTAIPVCEDSELWARVAGSTGFVYLDQPVIRYRTGAASLMHNLAPNDDKLHVSYRIIQNKFRSRVGRLRALYWKIWVRAMRRR